MKIPSFRTDHPDWIRARYSALRGRARITRDGLGSVPEKGLPALAKGAGLMARAARVTAAVLRRCALAAAAVLRRFGRTAGSALKSGGATLRAGATALRSGAATFGVGAAAAGSRVGAWVQRTGLGPRVRRGALALAVACALLAVRVWLIFRVMLAARVFPGAARARGRVRPPGRPAPRVRTSGPARPAARSGDGFRRSLTGQDAVRRPDAVRGRGPRPAWPSRVPPPPSRRAGTGPAGRLTGRGGVVVMFGACFLGLLIADWAGWAELADAVFFMASSLTAYYVRPGSLLPVAVSPPLLFFAAMALEKLMIASGMLAAFSGVVVALASAAPWLFAGTGLTLGIALLRGLPREVRTLVLDLRAP